MGQSEVRRRGRAQSGAAGCVPKQRAGRQAWRLGLSLQPTAGLLVCPGSCKPSGQMPESGFALQPPSPPLHPCKPYTHAHVRAVEPCKQPTSARRRRSASPTKGTHSSGFRGVTLSTACNEGVKWWMVVCVSVCVVVVVVVCV